MTTEQSSPTWKTWQKIAFRFLFLFLSFFALDYLSVVLLQFTGISRKVHLETMLSGLNKPFYWLDSHFYHIGYNPLKDVNFGPDYRFGVVEYISVLIICVFACIIWSWLDRSRPSYNKLNYWFRVYLRYTVAIVMFGYGFLKLIPVQMSYPDAYTLLTPVGDQNHFDILWNFIGASPAYEMFTGICEITGSLLLLFRRSSVFGSLFMCTILINVVALNIFYNVSVKIFSSLLLVCVLFLLAPFFHKLFQLFFYQREVSFAEKHYYFGTKMKNRLLSIFGVLLIVSILTGFISRDIKTYKKNLANREKIYDVTSFVTKDALPLNITDTLNWKRFVLARIRYDTGNYAIIYNSREEDDWYYYKIDSTKKTFILNDVGGEIIHSFSFNYIQLEKDQLSFTGKWKGYDVKINMKPVIDSMQLNKEKIKVVLDH